jgi:hypothetical protein
MALALYVRFALIAAELMRRNELSRRAKSRHCRNHSVANDSAEYRGGILAT